MSTEHFVFREGIEKQPGWINKWPTVENPAVAEMRTKLFTLADKKFQGPLDKKARTKAYQEWCREWAKQLDALVKQRKITFEKHTVWPMGEEGNIHLGFETDWVDAGILILPHLPLLEQIVVMPEGYKTAGVFFDYFSEEVFMTGPQHSEWVNYCTEGRFGQY